ncbi:MAG: DMT family transporter [Gammaproteobacteria bacterium]
MQNITSNRHELKATILVAISATLYGFLAYLGTELIRANFSIENMLFWRFTIAAIWMAGFYIIHKRKTIRHSLPQVRSLLPIFLLGALGYSGSCGFYFLATRFTGTGLAMVIFFSYPMMVAILVWLADRQSINMALVMALIAISFGLYLLKGPSTNHINLWGIFFALLAALSYAVYVYGTKWTPKTIDSGLSTIVVCLGCASAFLLITLFTHTFVIAHTLHDWLYIIALSVFATAIPIQLMLEGLKSINPVHASILSVLEPLVTVGMGIALLGETISAVQAIGCLIILVSALAIQFQRISSHHSAG